MQYTGRYCLRSQTSLGDMGNIRSIVVLVVSIHNRTLQSTTSIRAIIISNHLTSLGHTIRITEIGYLVHINPNTRVLQQLIETSKLLFPVLSNVSSKEIREICSSCDQNQKSSQVILHLVLHIIHYYLAILVPSTNFCLSSP